MEDKKDGRRKLTEWMPMIKYGLMTLYCLGAMIYVGIHGLTFGMMGFMTYYGSTAAIELFWTPFLFISDALLLGVGVIVCLGLKIRMLIKCERERSRLAVMAAVSVVLVIVTLIAIGPISDRVRVNKDITEEVRTHFAEAYGADGLEILVLSKNMGEYPHIVEYKVKSPAVDGALKVEHRTVYLRNQGRRRNLLEYDGTTWLMDEATGEFVQLAPEESVEGIIFINEVNFPDAVFRDYVAKTFDWDANGRLSEIERKKASSIRVSDMGIADLTGIEWFTDLQYLYCSNNRLTSLDLSSNEAVTWLDCEANALTSLKFDWHVCTLKCGNNQLNELDLTYNTYMEYLDCSNNMLSTLNAWKCEELRYLDCTGNRLTELDASSLQPSLELKVDPNVNIIRPT